MKQTSRAASALSIGLALSFGCSSSPRPETTQTSRANVVAQQPVNPNASPKARQVLQLLYDLPSRADKKVISGQVLHPLDWDDIPGGYKTEPGHLVPYQGDIYDRVSMLNDQTGYWVGIAASEGTDWENEYYSPGQQRFVSELLPSF